LGWFAPIFIRLLTAGLVGIAPYTIPIGNACASGDCKPKTYTGGGDAVKPGKP
jgi:hypothetical protein